MSDTPEKKAPAKKPAAAKTATTAAAKPAAAKTTAEKPVALKTAAKKAAPAAKKEERTVGLKVTQIGSGFGRGKKQIATLKGLGLNKMHRSRILEDTPSVRGMVNKVSHLVKIEQVG